MIDEHKRSKSTEEMRGQLRSGNRIIIKRPNSPKLQSLRASSPCGRLSTSNRYTGKFVLKPATEGPAYEFSVAHRLDTLSLEEIANSVIKNKNPSSYFVNKNKESAQNYTEIKQENIKYNAKRTQIRCWVSKQFKKNVTETKKEVLIKKINDKEWKFELRMKSPEVKHIKRCWLAFFTIAGFINLCRNTIANRKRLHERTEKILGWVKNFAKFVGKQKILLTKIRKKRSLRFLRIYLIPYVKRWLRNKKQKYRNAMIDVIEESLTSDILFSLKAKWKSRILYIQRSLKTLLLAKRMTNFMMIQTWNATEVKRSSKIASKKGKRTVRKKNNGGTSSIPDRIKLFYMRNIVKEAVKAYSIEAQAYLKELRYRENASRYDLLMKNLIDEEGKIILPEEIKGVVIDSLIDYKTLKDLIDKAERERSQWEGIIKQEDELVEQLSYNINFRS